MSFDVKKNNKTNLVKSIYLLISVLTNFLCLPLIAQSIDESYLDSLEKEALKSFSIKEKQSSQPPTNNQQPIINQFDTRSTNNTDLQKPSTVQQEQPQETVVLQGSVEKLVPSGTPIQLKITSMPMRGQVYLDYWDVNQEFIPPKKGDQITSELTKPIYIEGNLVIPKRTKFYGYVSNVTAPKRFGKDGSIEVSFEGLQTPSGKYLKFTEQPNNLKKDLTKQQKIAHGIVRAGSYALGGVATGVLAATQTTGLLLTAIQPEYIFMTGAGIGLLVGVVASIVKKGKPGRLMPGDEIQINLQKDILLPVAEPIEEQPQETYQVEGLDIQIQNQKLVKDDLGKSILVIDLKISNMANITMYGNDFFLQGPYNKIIYPGGLSLLSNDNNSVFFDSFSTQRLYPGQSAEGQIAFEIDFPGFEHFLCFKQRRNQHLIYKSSLGSPNDYIQLSKMNKFKNKLFGGNSDPWN